MRASLWAEYRGSISLLRLPGAEGSIGGRHDREPTEAGCFESKGIPGEVRDAFEGAGQSGDKGLRLPDMLKLFLNVISSSERVHICVDAVDELQPQDRSEFLRALRQIIQEAPNTRLFLTGRPHIRGEVGRHLTEGAYSINIVADKGDIVRYLSRKMDDDNVRDPDLMTEDLENDIMKRMSEKASEM